MSSSEIGSSGNSVNPKEMPSAVLRHEHQVIQRVMASLETLVNRSQRGDGFEIVALRRCVEFFRLFADACHHAKEEDLLFPALEQSGIPRDGGPIGVMLEEHRRARALTQEMADALDAHESGNASAVDGFNEAARGYIELLTHHIHKEDNILFVMGDNVLSDEAQHALCKSFCEVGCATFGGMRREQLEQIADELEQQWMNT